MFKNEFVKFYTKVMILFITGIPAVGVGMMYSINALLLLGGVIWIVAAIGAAIGVVIGAFFLFFEGLDYLELKIYERELDRIVARHYERINQCQ